GLSIKMIDPDSANTGMKSYTVKVRWDDYDVKQDMSWAGDIVLKEQLNLLQGKTITLQQNWTPNQIEKDTVSNFFSKTTFFTCEPNSTLNMNPDSKLLLEDRNSLIIDNEATVTIHNGAVLVVKEGSTLIIYQGP